ncbi:MAG: hypothetical protein FD146_1327 [Anaerolineaceae bacterium]|nr:MAG: hypothetical protein FD146_1327 [Anaerolineaceae bacterium]
MKMQTIATNPAPVILVRAIPGDLRAAGWDRNELMAKTDGDALELVPGSDPILITCDENLILYLPRGASLKVESVAGDASLQALGGALDLGPVAGDLNLHDLGPVTLADVSGDASLRNLSGLRAGNIAGDFTLRNCAGDCEVASVGGDASIREVGGAVQIPTIGSDLYLRKADGPVDVSAGADVVLFLEPHAGMEYHANAGDDLLLRLPPDASATLHLTGGSPESIQVDFPGVQLDEECEACDVTIGGGEAQMYLLAGDDLVVTSQADQWDSAADFGIGMKDSGDWDFPPIPPIPPDFSERINRRVRDAMERSQSRLETAGRRAEAAVRRAEAKARAAEVRARRGAHATMNIGRWNWDLSPHGPAEAGQAVSDEERLTILRMLQKKKITLEDAEKLLAALEGK